MHSFLNVLHHLANLLYFSYGNVLSNSLLYLCSYFCASLSCVLLMTLLWQSTYSSPLAMYSKLHVLLQLPGVGLWYIGLSWPWYTKSRPMHSRVHLLLMIGRGGRGGRGPIYMQKYVQPFTDAMSTIFQPFKDPMSTIFQPFSNHFPSILITVQSFVLYPWNDTLTL